jgi:hypothetical protein
VKCRLSPGSGYRGCAQLLVIKKISDFAETILSIWISDRPTRQRQLLARNVRERLRERELGVSVETALTKNQPPLSAP